MKQLSSGLRRITLLFTAKYAVNMVAEVRSSIARRLGLDVGGMVSSGRDVEGIVDVMLDATQHFSKPLTATRLTDWHAALLPTGRSGMHTITVGAWRTAEAGPMQVVSGPIGRECVHFEAPHASTLDSHMADFLQWLEQESSVDGVLKAGLAHLWFVTIHPFDDGNGRLARAIADMCLARSENLPERFYSLSTQILSERKHYYDALEKQQRSSLDVTDWLAWFVGCLDRAVRNAEKILDAVLYKAQVWALLKEHDANDRQCAAINRMLEPDFEGHMNTSKYAKMAKCSTDTTLRDIQALVECGILTQNESGGRSTSYRLIRRAST